MSTQNPDRETARGSPWTEAGGSIKRRTNDRNIIASVRIDAKAPERSRLGEGSQTVPGCPCPRLVRHVATVRSEDLGEVQRLGVLRVDDSHGILDPAEDLSGLADDEGSGAETRREDHGECWTAQRVDETALEATSRARCSCDIYVIVLVRCARCREITDIDSYLPAQPQCGEKDGRGDLTGLSVRQGVR